VSAGRNFDGMMMRPFSSSAWKCVPIITGTVGKATVFAAEVSKTSVSALFCFCKVAALLTIFRPLASNYTILRPIINLSRQKRKCFRGIFLNIYFVWEKPSQRVQSAFFRIGIIFAAYNAEQKFKEDVIMSSTNDKIRGSVNDAVGNVTKNVGKATDDEKMESEGEGQQVKGKAQKALGNARDAVSNAADSVSKAVKNSGD
jgi:uncharacterized protein YjbJ (UPF0337 family)